jgi:tRNA 2-thiouridine synthesizing protein A
MSAAVTLDAQGLKCPLPVLRARKAMRDLPPGGLLRVLATDPAAPRDFRAFCDETGYALVDTAEAGGVYTVTIRKKG